MANYANLKEAVNAAITTNGNNEITGAILNNILNSIISTIGGNYTFAGVVTPSTTISAPDANVFWIGGAGTYTQFGGTITIASGNIGVFTYNGSYTRTEISVASLVNSSIGYYECSSAAGSHKYIDIPEFALSTHLLFFVKFLQYNSKSNPLLYINSANAHSIIYNGEAVSPTNTWGGGEVVMIYYDGINYVATPLAEYTNKKQGLLMHGVFALGMPQLATRSRVSLYAYKGQRTTFKLTLPNTLSAYCAIEVRKVKDGVITTVANSGVSVASGSLTNSKAFIFPESAMYFIDVYTTAYAQLSGDVSISITSEDTIADYFVNEERLSALEACLDLHRSDAITLVNYPASSTGGNTSSGAFKGYEVDLTSIRSTYKYIYFRGSNSSTSNNVVRGVITNDSNVVENYTQTTESYSNGWQSLPITSASKTFRGTYCILSDYGETWYPTIVYFAKEATNIAEIIERLDELSEQIGERFPSTYLPATTYAVVGDTLQLFNRGVTISQNPSRWYNNFTCNIGKVYSRYLELTPTNAGSSYTIAHRLIDDHFNYSTQKNTSLSIAAKPTTSPASNINVLCVGASTTEGGEWASELKRRLTGSGGSPEANGLSNITFVGRKSLEPSVRRPMAINVEATGGWTWRSFYTPADALRFVVSGVSAVNIGDVYQFSNASGIVKIQVAEVNVTGSSGNIRFLYNWNTEARGLPTSQSGTLTKVSGSGDNTITYTSATEENYAPFYDEATGNADFTGYADTYCNGQIDAVIFNMGTINEGIMGNDSLVSLLANMKTLIDALHADFPSCKVILCNGGGFNQYHGVEYNYGAASRYTQWGAMYGQFRYAEALNEFIASNNYRDWCFIANTIGETDSEHIFPTEQKAVNTRVTDETETIGTNGAHPTLAGYQMIADCVYRCFVNVIL